LPLALWGRVKIRDALTTGEPRAIAQIVVELADGTTQTIVTDETWRVGDGPILRNSIYLGEVYDARREQPGWDKVGFDDSAWKQAVLAVEPQLGVLEAQDAPPIRVARTLKPVKLTQPSPGVFVFDLGQNFAGWARLKVSGNAGTCVKLRFGELLYPDGTLNGMTSVTGQIKRGGRDYRYDDAGEPETAFQQDEYVLKGHGQEVFTPRFTFHGFRYVEVTGFPGKPTLSSLEGLQLHADVQPAGSFECSNERFNRIQQMVLRTELSNLFSVQSDCPHREKFGYGGDLVASSEMGMLNFNMASFYAKVAGDFADAVRPNGGFTETAPFVGISDPSLDDASIPVNLGNGTGPVDFGVVEPLLLCQLYQYYGNRQLIAGHYEATRRWIDLLSSKAQDGILDNGISDHESLAPKPRALTGTAFYYFNVKLFARLARVLGKNADAEAAETEASRIKAAFNRRFLDEAAGRYDFASQACQAIPLYFGLVPTNAQPDVLDNLTGDISAHDGHLTTGIFGTKYMLSALSDAGRTDVAYTIVDQQTFPGWGYMLENGATTLWEHWTFSDNIYSHNHPMFGSVSEWFYKALGGIQPAPDAIGFDKIIIHPHPVGNLTWVKASYNSIRGRIASAWEQAGGKFKLHLVIPPNTTAVVYVPAKDVNEVTEGGLPAKSAAGLTFLRMEQDTAIFAAGSGRYEIESSSN
jgi:alpha-L-rhamnosidase